MCISAAAGQANMTKFQAFAPNQPPTSCPAAQNVQRRNPAVTASVGVSPLLQQQLYKVRAAWPICSNVCHKLGEVAHSLNQGVELQPMNSSSPRNNNSGKLEKK
jgi:hypothetical protein